MSYETTGTIKLIQEIQKFDSGFEKREFVITTDEKYTQDIKFELTKDNVVKTDAFKVGQSVKVSWNLRGNEYNSKYYVNLQAWRIELAEQASHTPQHVEPIKAKVQGSVDDIGEDDLPF